MNKVLTNVIRDVLLLGIGAATGALITNKVLDKKYNDLANEEIANYKEECKAKLRSVQVACNEHVMKTNRHSESHSGDTDGDNTELPVDDNKPTKREELKTIREFKKVTHDYTSYNKKPDLAGLAKKYDDPENNFEFRKDEETGMYNLDTSNAPYLITQDEFFKDQELYDKVTVEYWAEDDVYSDNNDEVIHDIGYDGKNFDLSTSTVFIRNDARRMDYEVIINTGSYYRDVLGYDDDIQDDRPRKKANKYEEG